MQKKGEVLKLQKVEEKLKYDESMQDYEIFLMRSWKKGLLQKKVYEPYLQIKSEVIRENPFITTLELVSSNPYDGLIAQQFNEDVITHENFWNLMGEAPNEKYTTKVLKITPCIGTPAFFYYFINGKYGKGMINDDGRFTLYQNNEKDPSKKRNLWTE